MTSTVSRDDWLLVLVGLGLFGLLLLLIRWWQQRPAKVTLRPPREKSEITAREDEAVGPLVASLHLVEDAPGNATDIVLDGDNLAIGRDHEVAQIVFGDDSVARLHARIRQRNGRYYLYDEGSANGTFLNHNRLGLSPRQLQDGDEIRLGRLLLRFHLRPPAQKTPAQPENVASEANIHIESKNEDENDEAAVD